MGDGLRWTAPEDPDGFLTAFGEFPVILAGNLVEALADLWNEEMTRAVDKIAPRSFLPQSEAK